MLGFRVWDTKNEEFYYSPSWKISQEGVLMWGECENNDDSFISMQSTGLKDVNGKEIFEGDIIALKEGPSQIDNVVDFLMYVGSWNFSFDGRKISTKVLGNKFENPELVEKTE